MVIYLNANGTIQQIYPETLTQGSNSQSIVLLTNGISQGSAISVTFELPNGEKLNGGIMIQQDEFVLNDEYVNAYTFDLTKSITNLSGNLKMSFEVLGGGLTTNSYELTVPIIKSIAPVIPTQPSDDEWYAQILEAYNYILQQVDVDIPQDIADAISDHNTSGTAHADIRQKITDDISAHNSSATAHADIRQKITDDIATHNSSETAHAYIRGLITALGERVTTNEGDISDLKTLTSGHTTEINNLKNGTTVIPTYELKANKITSWSGADNTTYPSAKLVKDTIDAISSSNAYSFDTLQHFLDWLDGEYTRPDGVIPSQLNIGNEIYIIEAGTPDYWVSSKSDPMTINDFSPLEASIDLSDYVQKTTTIAGVDLQDNITKSELANALGISPDLNIENGDGDGSVKLKGNTSQGDRSSALGHNNTVQADRALANGGGNVIRYDSSNPTSINGYMGFASGQNNYVSGWGAAAIGSQLEAKNSGQFITGSANKYKTDTYFEVGNGKLKWKNVTTKPSWQDILDNPIYYRQIGDGYTKITENSITQEQYGNLTIADIYEFDDSGRSNAFEVKRDGSISLGTNDEKVFDDFKTYAIALVINQAYPAYPISTLMSYGYDVLKANYGDAVTVALSQQFSQMFSSCDEAISYLINYTLGITYDDNEIKAPLSAAFGIKNVIYSLAALANGYNNKIGKADAPQSGTASVTFGVNNENYGENSIIVGDTNKIENASRSATFGNGNIVKNSQGFDIHDAYGFGQGLKVEETHQTAVGRYNDATVSATAKLFEVGNGTADNARSNAFEVMENGVVRAYGTPSGNNDLITKGYADSHYSGGGGGSVSIDNTSITENVSNEIQAVGVIGTNGLLGADTIDTGLTIQIYEEND